MNEREKACADINAIYYSHLLNYDDWNADVTLANWFNKAKPNLPRAEWDKLCREVKEHMKEREKNIQMWTRQTIDEALPN